MANYDDTDLIEEIRDLKNTVEWVCCVLVMILIVLSSIAIRM